jgi:HAMP domain-containing protein
MPKISNSRFLFPATLGLAILAAVLCVSGAWRESSQGRSPYLMLILTTINLSVFAMLYEIVSRLRKLRNEVTHIAKTSDVSLRVKAEGNDEIFDLANNINVFLSQLESAQDFLIVAREAAESADRTKSILIDELRRRERDEAFSKRSAEKGSIGEPPVRPA